MSGPHHSPFDVVIVDFGGGNLGSVARAFERLSCPVHITQDPGTIESARAVVLPGVGHFGAVMRQLDQRGLRDPLRHVVVDRAIPFLGICVGMQALFEGSEEAPDVRGLGLVPGACRRLRPEVGLKIPQVGWNAVRCVPGPACASAVGDAARGHADYEGFAYFVNSYVCVPEESVRHDSRWAYELHAEFGRQTFCAGLVAGSITAMQFHPEKSGAYGLRLLRHWLHATRSSPAA